MSRGVPFCRAFLAADIAAGTSGNRDSASLLCIGSRCNMHVAVNDHTTTPNLMRCADNDKAEPWVDPAAKEAQIRRELHIVCDSLPGPNSCIFIEAEDSAGRSVNCGEWRTRPDGLAELVITELPIAAAKEGK